MPSSADIADIRLQAYEITYDSEDIGFTTNGSTVINVNGVPVPVDNVEQLRGVVKLFRAGWEITVDIELKDTSPATINGLAMRGESIETSGGKSRFNIGDAITNMEPFAAELKLHVQGIDLSDTSDDWLFFKAVIVGPIALTGSNIDHQVLPLTFQVLPDFDKSSERRFGAFGSHDISQGTPRGIWITMGKRPITPSQHLTALTLDADQVDQIQAFEHASDISTTITALLNDAGLVATDKDIVVDALTVDNGVAANDFLILDSASGKEIVFVESVVRINATEATYTTVRGVHGTTAAAHANDVTVELLEDVSVTRITDSQDVAWASDDPADVAVGDTFTSTTQNKGQVSHVAVGSANITATFNAVASPVTLITST